MNDLRERSRRSGGRLMYRSPGVYRVLGDRWVGAAMAVEAVDEAIRKWCRRVRDER